MRREEGDWRRRWRGRKEMEKEEGGGEEGRGWRDKIGGGCGEVTKCESVCCMIGGGWERKGLSLRQHYLCLPPGAHRGEQHGYRQ